MTEFFDNGTVRDMTLMQDVTEDSIHDTLFKRFEMNMIYTYIGKVLIAMNPFRAIPNLVGTEVMQLYRNKYLHENPPHIYAITDRVFDSLMEFKVSQAVIITGESGAGKTESSKILMSYLSNMSGSGGDMERVKEHLLMSNPPLEAFGNAKTLKNDNSSRFGKYLNIAFHNGSPIGGQIQTYMLEKSRVMDPGIGERNFHIFYQVINGMDLTERSKYDIEGNVMYYNILNKTGVVGKRAHQDEKSAAAEDKEDFEETLEALRKLHMSEEYIQSIFRVISAILWLGQIEFVAKKGNSELTEVVNREPITKAATLLGLDEEVLLNAMLKKTSAAGREIVKKDLRADDATSNRDSLGKLLFIRVFNWMVLYLNEAIDPDKTELDWTGVGVLDIYGFEIFENNSFEQFCINYVNESLQQVFIEKTLKEEQKGYTDQGIPWDDVPFFDNKAVCELIEGKMDPERHHRSTGIFTLLCETSKFPKGDDNLFIEKIHKEFANHQFYKIPRGRGMMGKPLWVILHYAGEVLYNAKGFVEKNKDEVTTDHLGLGEQSSLPILQEAFPKGVASARKSKKTQLAGEQFMQQVQSLVSTLQGCSQHFIRCMKPNETRTPLGWESDRVRHQIQYLGLLENIKIRRAGYAFNYDYYDFKLRYKFFSKRVFPDNQAADDVEACKFICEDQDINGKFGGYAMGTTKLFLKEPKSLIYFETQRKELLGALVTKMKYALLTKAYRVFYAEYKIASLIQGVQRMKDVLQWRKDYNAATSLQRFWRGYIVREFLQTYRSASRLQSMNRGLVIQSWRRVYKRASGLQSFIRSSVLIKFVSEYRLVSNMQAACRPKALQYMLYEYRLVSRINACWRTYTCRNWYKEYQIAKRINDTIRVRIYGEMVTRNRAAWRIQSAFRGSWRNSWWATFKQVRNIQALWRGYNGKLQHRRYIGVRAIQTMYRTHVHKNMFNIHRASAIIGTALQTKQLSSMLKVHRAASRIQGQWKCYVTKSFYSVQQPSAVLIAYWKRFCMSEILEKVAASRIQTWFRFCTYSKLYKLTQTAIVLQKSYRCYEAHIKYAKIDKAWVIECWYRAIELKKLLAQRRAALVLQKSWRMHCARRLFWEQISALRIQTLWRAWDKRLYAVESIATTRIQSAFRGFRVRRKVERFLVASYLQATWKMAEWRNWYVINQKVRSLQVRFRGILARGGTRSKLISRLICKTSIGSSYLIDYPQKTKEIISCGPCTKHVCGTRSCEFM